MRSKILNKFIATTMLTAFMTSNMLLTASAMEDILKPELRTGSVETSLRLKGDVAFTNKNIPISISLRDSDVKQVLRMFADKAGMNIIFHNSVDGKVTLDLVEVPLNDAFELVMETNELSYVIDNNTIIVAKAGTENSLAKQEMTLIPVKYINASALAEFLNKNIYGIKKPGFSGSDIAVTNPATNELLIFGTKNDVAIARKIVDKFDKKPTTTTFKVNHTTPAEMADMICNMLLPAAGSDGGSSSGGSTGGAAGIMTGAAANSSGSSSSSSGGSSSGGGAMALNAGNVACTVDSKVGSSLSSLGLQTLSVAYYEQLGTITVLGGSEQQVEMIKEFIAQTDKKQPQAYLEVSIVELSESGSKSLQNEWNFYSSTFSATFNGESTSTHPMYPIFFKGNQRPVWDTSSDDPELKTPLTKFDGPMNISYAINYLIKNSKARVVANPRIIITNGEEASIEITQDYIESTETEMTAYTGGTMVTRTYNTGSDAGIKVNITPFISPDGYVTLNITPEYATILDQPKATDSGGEYIAATLLSKRNLDLKNVRIKDGETLVIGGLINEEETKSVGKVPILGDLPIIGAMFRSTSTEKKKNEMVIMLTPKIITDTEDAVGNIDTL